MVIIDEDTRAEAVTKYTRAVAEPILKKEFGETIMDELFSRFKILVVEHWRVKKPEIATIVMHITKTT